MSKKIFTLLSLVIISAMVLSACASEEATTAVTEADCPKEEVLCVGLVTDVGEVDDKSFNQSAWEGAQQGAEAVGGFANYVETKDAKDAAKANPDVKFIGVDQGQWTEVVPNVAGLIFDEAKSGFLAGVLAGSLTKSKTVAAVLGTDLVPPVVSFNKGYIAGAQWVDPEINVISTYHPGGMDVAFTDPEWGAATAKQAITQGADVVFGAGGKTGNGALIETAGNAGLFCIGVDSDQWETVPEAHNCLVSSAMKLITPGVVDLIKMAKEGTFPSGNFFGGAGLAPFHDFDASISQEIKDKLAAGEAAYDAGQITLP